MSTNIDDDISMSANMGCTNTLPRYKETDIPQLYSEESISQADYMLETLTTYFSYTAVRARDS